ncbi:class II aldolase/adducin family protein [Sulfurospirillum diekertiae]|uniref:Methylthioribulose-1-phosphate dehydratase n=1 Tax=Sulfurospirillum diekertiae TaxID=1854492 RepID=A0A1Y0HN08_9BACT|nr:class II aldolase/adducin family protein [Sulfurospirillum diekertiae]ARU49517.1 Methylthioribulose-1-phosphate dehydratase [Sulfurospirillum diekertiae]ASC94321.1 Methylthioribulose-1-phosphate dehydratase [Sulfurospirillum diekertiae]
MKEIQDLVSLSKYAGERFDLVQAGGGNSSVKLNNGTMLIKASGFLLSDVEEHSGYAKVNTAKIAKIVKNEEIISSNDKRYRERLASILVKEATVDINNRPSIETLLHSLLYKYTLHTHPIVVNMIVNKNDWKVVLKTIFKEEIVLIEYQTPGIELALALYTEISKYEKIPKIIFLQNHGLIITSDNMQEIKFLKEYVLNTIECYLHIDLDKYKVTNIVSTLVNQISGQNSIAYLSNDIDLNMFIMQDKNLFLKTPFCPDSLVYCGICAVEITDIKDSKPIQEYQNTYYETPKILLFNNKIYIIAQNIKKAKEIEDALRFHIIVLENNSENTNFLEFEELAYLMNWEAEKYRQKI